MQFLARPRGPYQTLILRALEAAFLLCAFLGLGLAPAAAQLRQLQNLVPAIYSFDSALALLGLRYGVDPAVPVFTASGSVTTTGFSWETSGTYLGSPLALNAAGTFDTATNSISWTGSGSYAGTPWAMEGITRWDSDTNFAIKDSISIGGVLTLYSGTLGAPDFNTGTMTQQDGGPVFINELGTRHWYSFLFGSTTDGWVVTVFNNGIIQTNVYTLSTDADKAGVKVEGGKPAGTIEIGGTRYTKLGFVQKMPEPATWMTMILGFASIGAMARSEKSRARGRDSELV